MENRQVKQEKIIETENSPHVLSLITNPRRLSCEVEFAASTRAVGDGPPLYSFNYVCYFFLFNTQNDWHN